MARQPRWYFDADTIGVGKLLDRRDATSPGQVTMGNAGDLETISRAVRSKQRTPPDHIWIPRVTAAGMSIITRDKTIQTRTSEIAAVVSSNARMFAITSEEPLLRWGLLEVIVTRWRDFEAAASEPGPFVYAGTRTGLRGVLLVR